jgi:hypothetical protein
MSLRKNSKWHLVSRPENSDLIADLPIRQRAQRQRFCSFCSTPIIRGEEHLAIWRTSSKFFPVRYNICCLCARERVLLQVNSLVEITSYLKKQLNAVDKYIKDNNLITKQGVHLHI